MEVTNHIIDLYEDSRKNSIEEKMARKLTYIIIQY